MIHVLQEDWEINRSWRAYGLDPDEGGREGEGRCTHLVIGEGRWKGVVLTLGVSLAFFLSIYQLHWNTLIDSFIQDLLQIL